MELNNKKIIENLIDITHYYAIFLISEFIINKFPFFLRDFDFRFTYFFMIRYSIIWILLRVFDIDLQCSRFYMTGFWSFVLVVSNTHTII